MYCRCTSFSSSKWLQQLMLKGSSRGRFQCCLLSIRKLGRRPSSSPSFFLRDLTCRAPLPLGKMSSQGVDVDAPRFPQGLVSRPDDRWTKGFGTGVEREKCLQHRRDENTDYFPVVKGETTTLGGELAFLRHPRRHPLADGTVWLSPLQRLLLACMYFNPGL